MALAECVHVRELVDHVTMMSVLMPETIEGFLTHDDGNVVSNALRGLWHAKARYPVPIQLRNTWLGAATQHQSDEWCLQQALETDQEFRMAWLERQCRNTNQSSPYIRSRYFAITTGDLTEAMRFELIAKVSPEARYAEKLIKALVADSAAVYSRLIEIGELERFHDSPLAR